MFTQQRKDKAARIYLERKTKLYEWIKDRFAENHQEVSPELKDLIELVADGTILCKLINLYFPNSIKKVVEPKGRFYYQRIENINAFIQQCHSLKVPIIFQTLDLFELKNPARVVNCIYCLVDILDGEKIKKRKMKRKAEFTIEELAKAHNELEIDKEASGEPLSAYLSESLPEEIGNRPTLQFQMSSSNTYDSSNLSVLDSSHQRMTVINTPKVSIGSGSSVINLNRKSIIYDLANDQLKQSQQQQQQMMDQFSTSDLATTASIKTAAISTTPIRKNVNSFNSSLFNSSNYLFNDVYFDQTNSTSYDKYTTTTGQRSTNKYVVNSQPMTLEDIEYTTDDVYSSLSSSSTSPLSQSSKFASSKTSSRILSTLTSLSILLVTMVLIMVWMILFVENHDKLAPTSITASPSYSNDQT